MRGPKPKNQRNALRQLRELVASPNLTQTELASILGISVDTVKSMEVGRLGPSPKILGRIKRKYGVQWDAEREEWISPTNTWRAPKPPRVGKQRGPLKGGTVKIENQKATLQHIHAHQEALDRIGEQRPTWDRDAIKWRIDELFDSVPAELWLDLFDQIQAFLDERREELVQHINGSKRPGELDKNRVRERLARVFNRTTPVLFFISNAETGKVYGNRSYPNDLEGHEITRYRVRMRNHYAEATRGVGPDGSRTLTFQGPLSLTPH